ncbi:MAG TPA: Fur family transcriptional regulator [bacterium]|nr:Fur family transcriptional regulator [bacterium]
MLAQAEIQERMRRFPERCWAAGLKVTHQRTAIFNVLAATDRHPSPEEVYEAVRPELPSISLATVYKVLDLFHRQGFLRKVSTEQQVARYDAFTEPHHHLVCDRCGRIEDVQVELTGGDLAAPQRSDFAISHYDIIFHGVCGACRRSDAAD